MQHLLSTNDRCRLLQGIAPKKCINIPYGYTDHVSTRASMYLIVNGDEVKYVGEISELKLFSCREDYFKSECEVYSDDIGFQLLRMYTNASKSIGFIIRSSFGSTSSLITKTILSDLFEKNSSYTTVQNIRYYQSVITLTSTNPNLISVR